ncbi:MAG: 4Fe-4S binding protein [Methanosarcinaceae archaeon]|nr:4Fe-4S binding protein [Methanosarcinaceae archaeon]
MSVTLNYNKCDSAPACVGARVCPTNAMTYDLSARKPVIDESLCIDCNICVQSCPHGAIQEVRA